MIFAHSSAMDGIMKKHPFQYVLGTCNELKGIWFTSILKHPRIKSVGGSDKISLFFFSIFPPPRIFPEYFLNTHLEKVHSEDKQSHPTVQEEGKVR